MESDLVGNDPFRPTNPSEELMLPVFCFLGATLAAGLSQLFGLGPQWQVALGLVAYSVLMVV